MFDKYPLTHRLNEKKVIKLEEVWSFSLGVMFGKAAALIRLQCVEGRVEPVLVGSRRTNQRTEQFFAS